MAIIFKTVRVYNLELRKEEYLEEYVTVRTVTNRIYN